MKAERVQIKLRSRLIESPCIPITDIRLVAGADAAYYKDMVCACIVVMSLPELAIIDVSTATVHTKFPYIPGLFAFRESPAILKSFRALNFRPDLLMIHGHGKAHPRRFGIASQIGVLLNIPSIGVAEHLLCGTVPDIEGSHETAIQIVDGASIIGSVVRIHPHATPLYVSCGHRTDLPLAVQIVRVTSRNHRLPEPLWEADRCCRLAKKEAIALEMQ